MPMSYILQIKVKEGFLWSSEEVVYMKEVLIQNEMASNKSK